MKSFFDWIKDLIYDSTDYIFMILIIVSVVFVIGWRLDLLFANDATDIPNKNIIVSENEIPKNNNLPTKEDLPEIAPTEIIEPDPDNVSPENPTLENPVTEIPKIDVPLIGPVAKSISISIPPGSLPSKIGSILETNGLVTTKNDFVKIAQQLKLDTKLKSGNYKIPANSSIEEILKIITK